MTRNFLVITLFFFVACSFVKPLQKDNKEVGVEVETEEEGPGVISIDEEYNPGELKKSKPKSISLKLVGRGPSSILYIGLLKSFENKRKRISSLAGTGWGSLVAALYAKYGKVSMVEWVYFKYFNKELPVKNSGDFEDLYEEYGKLIEKEFKLQKKSSLKIALDTGEVDSIYQFLESEMKKARDQSSRGLYWENSQNCQFIALESTDEEKICAKFSSSKKPLWDYEKIIFPFPVQDLAKNSLADLIARGRKFSDNNLKYLNY